jgi:hypothetical protein
VGSACHIVLSGASGTQNVDALFFMLGWAQYSFQKKRTEIHYGELMFLPLVRSTGHLVH